MRYAHQITWPLLYISSRGLNVFHFLHFFFKCSRFSSSRSHRTKIDKNRKGTYFILTIFLPLLHVRYVPRMSCLSIEEIEILCTICYVPECFACRNRHNTRFWKEYFHNWKNSFGIFAATAATATSVLLFLLCRHFHQWINWRSGARVPPLLAWPMLSFVAISFQRIKAIDCEKKNTEHNILHSTVLLHRPRMHWRTEHHIYRMKQYVVPFFHKLPTDQR